MKYCKMQFFYIVMQKQPPRGVLSKRFSENMQQIYRRTIMPKSNFNKVGMGVLLYICCIFSEHLLLRTALGGCFWWYLYYVVIYIFRDNILEHTFYFEYRWLISLWWETLVVDGLMTPIPHSTTVKQTTLIRTTTAIFSFP